MTTDVITVSPPTSSKHDQHIQFQREIIQQLAGQIVIGELVEPDAIAITIDTRFDNSLIRDFAVKNGIVTKAQFKDMERKARIIEDLGTVPSSAEDLVRIVTKRDKVECRYDGMLTRSIVAYMIDEKTGEKLVYDKESLKDPLVRMHCDFLFPKTLNTIEFERQARMLNDRLRLGFSRDGINDAVTQWYEDAKKARLFHLCHAVGTGQPLPMEVEAADIMWNDIATKIFDTTQSSPEFNIAVLKKFIWQAKRKLRNFAGVVLPVTNHLMPVILGPQGVGKSTFVNKFIEPLSELSLEVDFKMIEDDRNIDIWQSFILFLDEMGYASKANVDTIKHAITAATLARRPMRTNTKVTVAQHATFIGCSNKTLAQLIKDPTGIRRFVGLQFSNTPCRDTMNSIDYKLLWVSVDPEAADPMLPFMDLLKGKQEEDREKGRVEEWLAQFDPNSPSPKGEYGTRFNEVAVKGNKVLGSDLFLLYSEWEGVMFPGAYGRLNNQEFGQEIKRLLDNSPDKVPFEKGPRSSKGTTWLYIGAANVTPMQRRGYLR